MKKNESQTARSNSNFTMMMAVVMLSILFLVIGSVMLAFPSMDLKNFSYVVGGFFLAAGAWEVCRYFLREEYRNIANYDFTVGVLFLVAGIVTVIRAEDAAAFLYVLLGALVLASAATLLQYTVALKALGSGGWWATLIGSLALIALSLGILLDFNGWFSGSGIILYSSLIASGVIGLVALFAVALRVRHFEEELQKKLKRELEDDFYGLSDTPVKRVAVKAAEAITEKKPVDEDIFEDEGVAFDEPEVDAKGLKAKILSLKDRRKKPSDEIFADEEVG